MTGTSNARVRTMNMPIPDGYAGSWNDCAIGLRSQCCFVRSSFQHRPISGVPLTSFRFIHTADIHLDSSLIGLAGQEGSAADRIRSPESVCPGGQTSAPAHPAQALAERPHGLASHRPPRRPTLATTHHPTPVARPAICRHDPRQEPRALTRLRGSVRGLPGNRHSYRDRLGLARSCWTISATRTASFYGFVRGQRCTGTPGSHCAILISTANLE